MFLSLSIALQVGPNSSLSSAAASIKTSTIALSPHPSSISLSLHHGPKRPARIDLKLALSITAIFRAKITVELLLLAKMGK